MKFRFVLILLTLIISTSFFASNAKAQAIPTGALNVVMTPENPGPGESVSIKLSSYSLDINSATVIWNVNGTQVQKGIGKTDFSLTAPAFGKSTTINITVIAVSGISINQTITIKPSTIDLIIEPDGYVPPFFLGKIYPSYENTLKVTAIPHITNSIGKELDPTTLVYQWKKDSGKTLDQSGYGKQSVTLQNSGVPSPYNLTVTASTRDGLFSTSETVLIDTNTTSLLFYKNDPLYGPLYNKAIGNSIFIGSQKEVGVIAAPYGFNKGINNWGDVVASWLINDIDHPELATNSSIVLRAPSDSSGISSIGLELNNPKRILQSTNNMFSVHFNAGQ